MLTIKYHSVSNVVFYIGYLLFFLMLFLSTSGQELKMALLAIVFIGIIARLFVRRGRLQLDRHILFFYILLILIGVVGQLVGWYNNSPGYSQTYAVYVIYPFLYIFIIESIQSKDRLIALFKVMIIAGILISVYILSYVLVMLGLLPDFLFVPLDLDQRVNFSGSYVELNITSLVSLIYLFPFLCSIVFSKNYSSILTKRWLNITLISFLLVFFISIISGRRSLWVIMIFAVLMHFILTKIHSGKHNKSKSFLKNAFLTSCVGSLLMAVVFYFDISLMAIYENILVGFDSGEDHGAGVRAEQFQSLMAGFYESPLFGHGAGSSPDDMLQRLEPWAFELSYVALLYHTGIVGMSVYGIFVAWLFYKGIKIIASGSPYGLLMVPVLVATSSFLLANSVNPYLEKFDFIWTILLFPAVIINLHSIHVKEATPRMEPNHEVL